MDALQKRYDASKQTLQSYDQSHLLHYFEHLNDVGKAQLLDQVEAQDWAQLSELVQDVLNPAETALSENIEPAPYYPRTPTPDLEATYRQARERGEDLLRSGKVAASTVAGGQGTRLGWDGPKGTFPATPVQGKPLFQVFAETIRKAQQKYGATVPWYLMTSTLNDADTRAFFEEYDYFGLEAEDVMFFQQGSMPSIGLDGKVLLAAKDSLALNPDGHGGSLKALFKSGALDDVARRGVEHISYFQVDNPNVKPLDPLFIGLHALEGAEMSAKLLPKVGPFEKVGNFCRIDGRLSVIEYSDMPSELAERRDASGKLAFDAGSIAIHLLSVDFVRRLNESGGRFALPFHRANKKVPHLDLSTGEHVEPDAPNAVKLETFVFDALPLAEKSVLLETDRVEEFAPIKNATGDDSPETSRQLQSQRAGQWLQGYGVDVPFDNGDKVNAVIELSPLTAIEPEDLDNIELPGGLEAGSEVVL